jgi:hypothetical protein
MNELIQTARISKFYQRTELEEFTLNGAGVLTKKKFGQPPCWNCCRLEVLLKVAKCG